jgi:type III secretory pathway lipoprotein EscJ
MNKILLIMSIVMVVTVTGCNQDPIILRKICSQNGTYCEDLMRTNGVTGIAYENLSAVLDSRSSDNLTYWENLT